VLPDAPPDAVVRPAPAPRGLRPDVIKLRRERRNGRDVIVIEGLPADVVLEELARRLKSTCATGGTVKGRTIEIQGDHRAVIAEVLLERGFRSKRAGG
jgi:translation initiation factor 1